MKTKLKFTVIGYFEDNGQIWVEHVKANDEINAVVVAVKRMEKRNNHRDNMCIVGIFTGHVKEVGQQEKICTAIDWPGLGGINMKGNKMTAIEKQIKVCCDALQNMRDYLYESHQDELNNNHYGDGKKGCSYCLAIARADKAIAKTNKLLGRK